MHLSMDASSKEMAIFIGNFHRKLRYKATIKIIKQEILEK
jgi:hypothetical protein